MYGVREVYGTQSNPEILNIFTEIGIDGVEDDSQIAWCSAALNFICKKLNYERSGELSARSWLKMPITVLKPSMGDIVVLWRESPKSWKGHVGLYISEDAKNVYILGGNQGDSVCILPYPKERVLGYRRVHKLEDK